MRNIKKLMVLLAASTLLLAACNQKKDEGKKDDPTPVEPGGDDKEHVHDFHYKHNEDEHWTECECGETTAKVAHDFTETVTTQPTCTAEGVKTFSCVCGYSFTRSIDALGHSWDEGVVTTQPTATTPGEMTYTCTRPGCGATKTEPIEASVAIVEDADTVLAGYSKVYRLDVNAATLGFETAIEISDMDLDVEVAVKIVDGGDGVFYHPVIGGTEFQWITNEENTGGWADVYETWYKKSAKLTTDGKLTVKFEDYEQRQFPVGAKLYVAVEVINWKCAVDTAKTYEEGYTVYAVEVLKETGSFVAKINAGKASTEFVGAVNVEGGTTWVGVKGNNLDLWYRPEWHDGDWWVGYETWKEFSATTDDNNFISFEVNEYDAKFTAGTKLYVALKEAPQVKFTFVQTNRAVEGFSKVFELAFTSPSNSIETNEVVGKAGEIIKGAFTILSDSESVYFQPQIGDSTDKYFHSGDSWWVKFGDYTPFNATLDADGKLNIKINDYLGAQFPTGSILVIAFNGDDGLGYIVGKSNKTVDGYEDVYAIDIVKDINTFETKIACGAANAEVIGKVTVESGSDSVYFEPQIGDLAGTFWHAGDDWWTKFGDFKGFSATLDADGKLAVKIKDFSDVAFPAGSSIHIAVKPVPTETISVYKSTSYPITGYQDIYCIEVNKPTLAFDASVLCGEAGADIEGKFTIVCPESVYFNPQIGSSTDKWFKGGDGWSEDFGNLVAFTATLDAEGKLTVHVGDYGTNFPAESKIYIAVKAVDHSAPVCTVETSSEALPDGVTGQVYKVTLTEENIAHFSAKIPCTASGSGKLYVKVGEDIGDAWLIANTEDSWGSIMCNKNYGWSNHVNEWMNQDCTVTSDGETAPVYFSSANAGGGTDNPIAYTNGLVIYVAIIMA